MSGGQFRGRPAFGRAEKETPLMRGVFADTSYWFSLAVKADAHHGRTLELTLELERQGMLLYVSDLIIAETHRLILDKLGSDAGRRFLDQLFLQIEKDFAAILPIDRSVLEKARVILRHYADQDLTLTDATSAALMREKRLLAAVSYDKHFEIMGFRRLP